MTEKWARHEYTEFYEDLKSQGRLTQVTTVQACGGSKWKELGWKTELRPGPTRQGPFAT
jgi:hypothetical protein